MNKFLVICSLLLQPLVAISSQSYEFTITKSPLDQTTKGTPLLEGNLVFESSPKENISHVPQNLTQIEYTSVSLAPNLLLMGLRGIAQTGTLQYYFDQNGDKDLSDEKHVIFIEEENIQVARIPIAYRVTYENKSISKQTELSLYGRKPGVLEYHFNELWETVLTIGNETLNVALQHWPIIFLDINYSGKYDKIFFTDREVLALGGKFFKVTPDFVEEKLILQPTERTPVDRGFPASDFEVSLFESNKKFKLSDFEGHITVLNFWSPLCSGSRGQAARFSRLAQKFENESQVNFLAITSDEAALKEYLQNNPHHFQHAVSSELWELFGVTAPFVTFLIDQTGIIQRRYFEFPERLADDIALLIK